MSQQEMKAVVVSVSPGRSCGTIKNPSCWLSNNMEPLAW